jgi:hypothetical protein
MTSAGKSRSLVILLFAAIGLLIPVAILLAKMLGPHGFSPDWILYIWPSYFILGGLAGEFGVVVGTYVVVSIFLNIVLYAYVGSTGARLFIRSA